jgi:hypothetical protein
MSGLFEGTKKPIVVGEVNPEFSVRSGSNAAGWVDKLLEQCPNYEVFSVGSSIRRLDFPLEEIPKLGQVNLLCRPT